MKRNIELLQVLLIAVLITIAISCSRNKDAVIKADLATKAKSERDFAGVRFTVEQGIVTLSGECATETSKGSVESTAKGLYGVKSVINNIVIAPVVIGTDHLLKQGVDSVLQKYPGVEAITKDSIVYLQGKVENTKLVEMKNAISSLKPKMIENRLAMK